MNPTCSSGAVATLIDGSPGGGGCIRRTGACGRAGGRGSDNIGRDYEYLAYKERVRVGNIVLFCNFFNGAVE